MNTSPLPQPQQTVVVTTKNTASLTLGIIATVVGVLSLLVGWVPFLGLLALPAAVIGLVLAGLGLLVALVKGRRGVGMPLLGAAICLAGAVLPILSTGGTSRAITKAIEETPKPAAARTDRGEQEEARVKAAYIQEHLVLYEVQVKYMDSLLNGRVPGVWFKLRNAGTRDLDMVEVTVLFKDATGAVISEADFRPVQVSEYSFTPSKPLKAGYVWQMESGRFYPATSVPSEWKEGSVDAKITDVRFTK